MGGGEDLDAAFQWMCQKSGGGDFLVPRAYGTDNYNPYIQGLCHVNSVATLVIPNKAAAEDPFVANAIRKAEAIFISGGDEANYINFWKSTPVQTMMNEVIKKGVPIGGTSAGLAVQGEYIYTSQNDRADGPDLSSKVALNNPFHHQVILARGFLFDPVLTGLITDTHFDTRERLGRLLVFMSRILADAPTIKAMSVDEQTAALVEPDGHAIIGGHGSFNPIGTPFSTPHLHQFGVSAGGPAIKNKLFIFGNFEGIHSIVGNPVSVDSPVTALLHNEDGSLDTADSLASAVVACQQAENCDPMSMNLVNYNKSGQTLFLANPGGTSDPNDITAINTDYNNQNREDNGIVKVDFHATEHNNFNFTYFIYLYSLGRAVQRQKDWLRFQWAPRA